MRWFAYGTNMDGGRVRENYPEIRKLTTAFLTGYDFRFHKKSPEGGKADCFETGEAGDVVWGVVYDLNDSSRPTLEAANAAAGYEPRAVVLRDAAGSPIEAIVYVAGTQMIDASAIARASYKQPIVEAARSAGLPADYVARIESLPASP